MAKQLIISDEQVSGKIFFIRNKKVMLDNDLAKLYGVLTKNLNKAVKRNRERFPGGFCFQLTDKEFTRLKFQFGTSSFSYKHYDEK